MLKIILALITFILKLKFGWIIAIVVGVIIGFSVIKNIISGSFSVAKLASGFNPFTGAIQGKLIWLAIWCFIFFTAYQFIMRPTTSYDTDYKNNIRGNQDVIIDQSVGVKCIPTRILWGLIQIGCKSDPISKNVTNNCKDCGQKN